MEYSASKLIKCSAAQLVYFQKRKEYFEHLTDYDYARKFDNLWKHKEFGLLSNYFKFEKL